MGTWQPVQGKKTINVSICSQIIMQYRSLIRMERWKRISEKNNLLSTMSIELHVNNGL